MKKIILISLVLSIFSPLKAADEIQPSRATLESNVGEMQVEMIKLDNGHWKLNSLLILFGTPCVAHLTCPIPTVPSRLLIKEFCLDALRLQQILIGIKRKLNLSKIKIKAL